MKFPIVAGGGTAIPYGEAWKRLIGVGALAVAVCMALQTSNTPDIPGYLAALQNDGITYTPNSVKLGLRVCDLLGQGMTVDQVVSVIGDATVVREAHTYLCPDVGNVTST
jgi:hypothetical protein